MNILFLITTVGHGKGGHFHSLHTVAEELGRTHTVRIVNLGAKQSPVLNGQNYNVTFVPYNGFNFISAYWSTKKIVLANLFDVVHSFDVESFAFGRLLKKETKAGSFLTKCGGPDPKKYYPIANNLILFSKENLQFFKTSKKYRKTRLKLVPNRVEKINIDTERVQQFNLKYPNDGFRILRISRISKHYHKSILQGVNLVYWLRNNGLNVKFIIVGTVQSSEVFNAINQYVKSKNLEEHIIIETSDLYTKEASGILEIGDMILGTGRNFMEACSLNKKMLVPYKNSDYPLLVSAVNFDSIFSTNFSPRTEWSEFNEEQNLNRIKSTIVESSIPSSEDWFKKYFDVKEGAMKYLELYRIAKAGKDYSFDSIINVMYSVKTFVLK